MAVNDCAGCPHLLHLFVGGVETSYYCAKAYGCTKHRKIKTPNHLKNNIMTFKEFINKNKDKFLHASVCFILTTMGTALFSAHEYRLAWGIGFAACFAIGKEIYDRVQRPKRIDETNRKAKILYFFDQMFDLAFDIAGCSVACFCLTAIGA